VTINKDITESSSSYTYKTAPVTVVSGNGTTITYTAANSFSVGDVIDVTGSNIAGYNVTDATVATASATQFTVTNSATGTNSSSSVVAFTASSVTPNIDFAYDLTRTVSNQSFDLTNTAYDLSIADIPFILKIDNQNPYRRETAQYKKDQFDTSREPGEQSLTGWWVRSQTSWHNGAGIEFYEPGTDFEYTNNRFHDSRGVDIWTTGELRLHKDVFHAYTSTDNKLNAATGQWNDSGVLEDALIIGDSAGNLKRITLNGNSAATTAAFYNGATYPEGHNGTDYDFLSVTSNGSDYIAACTRGIHTGNINTLSSDELAIKFSNTSRTDLFVKYVKGFVLFGLGNVLYNLSITPYGAGRTTSTHSHTSGTDSITGESRTHLNSSWVWNDAVATPGPIFASGNGGNNGEVWRIGINADGLTPDVSAATMALSLPDGELINAIHYYLGFIILGTNKGIRICPIDGNDNPILGPLTIESSYPVNGFTERGSYIYAATKVDNSGNTNGILIRIDLSQQFSDGTFAYAYDLEYLSTPDNSDCTEVYNLTETQADGTVLDRLVMVIEEGGASGELQVEHTTNYRSSGYLQTGKIRYGTVEPKFFKYIQSRGLVAAGDSIVLQTIDNAGNEYDIITLDSVSLGENIAVNQPIGGQEFIAIKYTLNNGSPITDYPVLQSYQVKSIPGVPRQRIYQFPLSCYDSEMDKYNSVFGYKGRANEIVQRLEELEAIGDFVQVVDYRTNETFQGVIEEVRFTNESSPDKDSNGFGGLLLVTVRKL
jgi:hypothetical protein